MTALLSAKETEALARALENRDLPTLRRIRKTDLHCHGLLSATPQAYAQVLGNDVPPPPAVFGNFANFLEYIGRYLFPALRSAEAVRALVRSAFERMAADGVVYSEISFDLLVPDFIGVQPEELAEILTEERQRVADRITIAPEIGIARGLPPDELAPRLKRYLGTEAFHSVDLYDDERLGDVRAFVPLYRLAEDHGLKLKAHAGELRGSSAVRESVEQLRLHAVQHGVRAAEDPAVMDFLATRGTVLHVCPTSNFSLGVCDSLASHPARRLVDHGVKITINSDDFTLFGADVSDELLNLTAIGFTPAQIAAVVNNGLAEIPSTTRYGAVHQ